MEDSDIVDLYLSRDSEAVRQTMEKYGASLRRIALNITGDFFTAEECENDTYNEAWLRIPPHRPKTYFFAFLAKITRSAALDRCRSEKCTKRSAVISELTNELAECIPSPDDTAANADGMMLRDILSDFLRTLPEKKRSIFIRRYWFCDPVEDIAERFSMTVSNVKVTLMRTRNKLKKYLEKEGYPL